jgi:predicted 3-demethylubiquinone-9 3-methyltransferase (glyoxalase superfamily)
MIAAHCGKPQACGWIVDKCGVRWQSVPTVLVDMMSDPDKMKPGRVTAEMRRQVKFDIAKLKKAFAGR